MIEKVIALDIMAISLAYRITLTIRADKTLGIFPIPPVPQKRKNKTSKKRDQPSNMKPQSDKNRCPT
jgi:hypothetical protein